MKLFDPYDRDWLIDKHDRLKILREMDTLYWSEEYNLYCITDYEDCVFVSQSKEIFSSEKNGITFNRENSGKKGKTLASSDEPKHKKLLNVVKDSYLVRQEVDRVVDVVNDLFKQRIQGKEILNISDIANECMATAMVYHMNLPYPKDKITSLAIDVLKRLDYRKKSNGVKPEQISQYKSMRDISLIVRDCLDKQKETGEPGLYSEILKNSDEEYMVNLMFHLVTIMIGMPSLAGGLEFMVKDLGENPDQMNLLFSDTDKYLIQTVNECARFNAVSPRHRRTVMEDCIVKNTQLKKGDEISLCLDSANRDVKRWLNPDVLDITRDSRQHLSYGIGTHKCIARLMSERILINLLKSLIDDFGKYTIITKKEDYNIVVSPVGSPEMITNVVIGKR